MSKRAYKFRFYPTSEQELLLEKTFGCVRYVYNYILDLRSKAYAEDKTNIGFTGANAALTQLEGSREGMAKRGLLRSSAAGASPPAKGFH